MTTVPGIDAMVTVRTAFVSTDGWEFEGFAKVYARSGDLHQAWVRGDGGWDRLANVRPYLTLGDWTYAIPFELDPEWFA